MSSPSHNSDPPNYETWTRKELIARLQELTRSSIQQSPPPPRRRREFNFSAYPTRKIAFKFSYAGAGYGGLAWQDGPTPLPTVEGVLFAAFAKARLVDPERGLEGCGWERCGRTDRGVSAAGQVVSLYVRSSNRPSPSSSSSSSAVVAPAETSGGDTGASRVDEEGGGGGGGGDASGSGDQPPRRVDQPVRGASTSTTKEELRYLHTLNAILPPTIRVYAWAPVSPTFSARFSCRSRHYKYFFSARNLDVPAMRSGAARLVGEHDFRNLCKIDRSKQLTSFRRRILRADISPLAADADGADGMHVLDLVGTAFLYHQVRHIMAVLLLIGTRLESPRVISALLNVGLDEGSNSGTADGGEDEGPLPLVTRKPEYQMADALPLVLWDCMFSAEDAPWRTDDGGLVGGSRGLHSQLTGLAERAEVEATLAEHFLAAASRYHGPGPGNLGPGTAGSRGPWELPVGGGRVRREGRYVGLVTGLSG
ncbi:pseudouridine synthase [Russula dissimulans]|nr:pseudouridine synthase [Russula dissimulans]